MMMERESLDSERGMLPCGARLEKGIVRGSVRG